MFDSRLLPILALLTLVPPEAAAAPATGAPLPVSPGAAVAPASVASPCPTFSWGLLAGASRYQLEVAPVPDDESEAPEPGAIQRIELPGSVSSWTPPGVACFAPARPHAWRVRAETLDGWGPWSEPRLFVAPAAIADGSAEGANREQMSTATPGRRGPQVVGHRVRALDGASSPAASAEAFVEEVGIYAHATNLGIRGEGGTGVEGIGTYTGGYFSATQGPGLFAASVVESEADIVMGGDNALLRAGDQDGDLILESGDDVIVGLGSDSQGSSSNFVIRARGSTTNLFHVSKDGDVYVGGSMVHSSDRAAKADLRPVDTEEILRRVVTLPVQRWRWKDRPAGEEHLGPMAQDFHAAFGLGTDPRGIATVDADGVTLAAIQELARLVSAQREALERQGAELEQLRRRLEAALEP